jgi:hypothetical protein
MADHATTRRDPPGLPSTERPGNESGLLDGAYIETLVQSAGGAAALDAEGIEGDYVQPVVVDALLDSTATVETVTTVLAIREDDLEAFWGLDNSAFQSEVADFIGDRPFLTVDDAMRAVLRSFGVRARSLPEHVNIAEWGEQGWRLLETDITDLAEARLLV